MNTPVIVAVCSTIGVLGVGGALTTIGPWYASLRKPRWQPPNWLFAPVWTLIGGLTTWSAVVGWHALRSPSQREMLVGLFVVNGALNILWSLLFFNRRRPDLALIEVVLLWLSIAALMFDLAPASPLAAWLLAPYLAWVSVAAFLNLAIVRLNPSRAI